MFFCKKINMETDLNINELVNFVQTEVKAITETESNSKKVEIAYRNIDKILDLFSESQQAKKEFLKHFNDWKPLRKKAISKLKTISKDINKDKFNSNVSKLVASSVGIAGGIALVASILCPPMAVLTVGGFVASGLGGATALGTTITELVLVKKNLDEAKETLMQDSKAFSNMQNWFNRSKAMVDAIEKIISFDLVKELAKEVGFILDKAHDKKSGKYNVPQDKMFKEVLRRCSHLIGLDGIQNFNLDFNLIAIIITAVVIIVMASQRSRFVFDCILFTSKLCAETLVLSPGMSVEVGRAIGNTVTKSGAAIGSVKSLAGVGTLAEEGGRAISGAMAQRIAIGAFTGIAIALDVTNIVITSIDVHKGSVSEYSSRLEDAADELQKEMEIIEKLHAKLSQSLWSNIDELSFDIPHFLR